MSLNVIINKKGIKIMLKTTINEYREIAKLKLNAAKWLKNKEPEKAKRLRKEGLEALKKVYKENQKTDLSW